MSLKRRIYGLPIMRLYRQIRSAQAASKAVDTRYGFKFAGHSVFFREDWEVHERRIIQCLLPKSDVFIDVGANHGFYSCLAATSGTHAVAVEPEEGNLRFLKNNLRGLDAEIFPVAVADTPGILDLYGDGVTASLRSGWFGTAESFRQRVPANTLDNLFASRWPEKQLLIKIDVEGAEELALSGAKELIHRHPKPFWLIESFPEHSLSTVLKMMTDAGYEALRSDLTTPAPDIGGNFLFVEDASMLELSSPRSTPR